MAIVVCGLAAPDARAEEQPALQRTTLQSSEWPAGYNAMTITAVFRPNGVLPRHTHAGVENGYVLEGEFVLKVDGKDDLKLKPGDSWSVAANTPHTAIAGPSGLKVLVSYVLDKTQPFAAPAP